MKPDNSITKTELARRIGVHPVQGSAWEKLGMPVLPSGRVDPVEAERWVRENINPAIRQNRQMRVRNVEAATRRDAAAVREASGLPPEPNPADALASLALWMLAQRIPAAAATAAMRAGLSEAKARKLHDAMRADAAEMAGQVRTMMELPPRDGEPWTLVPSVFPGDASNLE